MPLVLARAPCDADLSAPPSLSLRRRPGLRGATFLPRGREDGVR